MTTTIETTTDDLRGTVHKCTECGRWEKQDKGGTIRHASYCESKAQVEAAPLADSNGLREFGRNVRTYSQTKGRNADVLEAVRRGHLSVNDAMNTDD